jgi:hypothetical protein
VAYFTLPARLSFFEANEAAVNFRADRYGSSGITFPCRIGGGAKIKGEITNYERERSIYSDIARNNTQRSNE